MSDIDAPRQCEACMYFFPISRFLDGNGKTQVAGECRRFPPVALVTDLPEEVGGKAEIKSKSPGVLGFKWCGEWTHGEIPSAEYPRV